MAKLKKEMNTIVSYQSEYKNVHITSCAHTINYNLIDTRFDIFLAKNTSTVRLVEKHWSHSKIGPVNNMFTLDCQIGV